MYAYIRAKLTDSYVWPGGIKFSRFFRLSDVVIYPPHQHVMVPPHRISR
jgi:hypothetical protein